MKLKKTLTSKPFIAGTLAVLCVGILGTCLFLPSGNQTEFIPEQPTSAALVESWTENESAATFDKEIGMGGGVDNTVKEEYPKVTESSEGQTVIDFTNPEPSKPTPPPAPERKPETAAPESSKPVQKDPTVTPPKQEALSQEQPQPDKKSETEAPKKEQPETANPDGGQPGQIYDPVFGWITPGEAQAKPIDAGGDPNKAIGNMN